MTVAAQPPSRVPSLSDALELNRQNAPAIQSRQRLTQQSTFRIEESRLAYRPKVIAQTQAIYATTNQVRGAFFPNAGSAPSLEGGIRPNGAGGQLANGSPLVWSSFTTLFFDWPLVDFGRTRSQVAVAQANYTRQQAALTNTTFQQQIETADTYLRLLSNQQLRQVEQANVERQTRLQQITLAHTRPGLQPGVDSALAEADLAKARLQLLNASQREISTKFRLAELTGLAADSITLQASTAFQNPPANLTLTTEALSSHPALLLQQADLDQGIRQAEAIRHSHLPAFRVIGAGFMRGSGVGDKESDITYNRNLGAGLRPRVFDAMIGVAMLWKLSDIISAKRGYQVQQQVNQGHYANLQVTQRQLRRAFDTATLRYQTAQQSLVDATTQKLASQQAYDRTVARYQSGLTSQIELSQTSFLLNQAEIRQQQAIYQNWQSLLGRAASSGSLTPFLQLIH